MPFNPDKHHRRSIRLHDYDYSRAGAYYITICIYNKEHLFGKIANGELQPNEYGKIAENEWIKTFQLRNNIEMDEFIIMPNHFHGIIIISNEPDGTGTARRAPTIERFSKPTSNTIPTIIRNYKSAVTKQINDLKNTPGTILWQRNYYEHAIRDEADLNRIREYIINNPRNWENDENFI